MADTYSADNHDILATDMIRPWRTPYTQFGPCRFPNGLATSTINTLGGLPFTFNGPQTINSTLGPQLVVQYDAANYATVDVSAAGNTTIACTGPNVNVGAGNILRVLNATNSTSIATGCTVLSGGLGVAGDTFCTNVSASGTISQVRPRRISMLSSGVNVATLTGATVPPLTFPHQPAANAAADAFYCLPDAWIPGTPLTPYAMIYATAAQATPYACRLDSKLDLIDTTHATAGAVVPLTPTDFALNVLVPITFPAVVATGFTNPCTVRLSLQRSSIDVTDTYVHDIIISDFGFLCQCSF